MQPHGTSHGETKHGDGIIIETIKAVGDGIVGIAKEGGKVAYDATEKVLIKGGINSVGLVKTGEAEDFIDGGGGGSSTPAAHHH